MKYVLTQTNIIFLKVTPLENVIGVIAFVYDINFKESFKILKEQNYINKILDRYQIKDEIKKIEVEKIREIANKYIKDYIG